MDALPAGTVLTASDPEPPDFTTVRASDGGVWLHHSNLQLPSPPFEESIEDWQEFATLHGPLTVIRLRDIAAETSTDGPQDG